MILIDISGQLEIIKLGPNSDSLDHYQSNIACISDAVLGSHVAISGNVTMIAIKAICAITNGKTPL